MSDDDRDIDIESDVSKPFVVNKCPVRMYTHTHTYAHILQNVAKHLCSIS